MPRVLVASREHREGCHAGRLVYRAARRGLAADPNEWYCPRPGCPAMARYKDVETQHKLRTMFDIPDRLYCPKCRSLFATVEAALDVPCEVR